MYFIMYWCVLRLRRVKRSNFGCLLLSRYHCGGRRAGCDKKYTCTDRNVHLVPSCKDGKIGHTTCPEANINNN